MSALYSFHKYIFRGDFQIFWKFLGIFGKRWFFLKGLVKFEEIRNIEDLICI